MSIIIKGMEMPTTCCDCKLIFFDETRKWEQMTGAYVCQMTGKVIWNTRRGDDCPLIELPPHGRLIDADEVRKSIRESVEECAKWANEVKEGEMYARVSQSIGTFVECSLRIKNAHTIIEAEGSGTDV